MKAQFIKYRPKYDYTGAHVILKHGDRELLGTIIHVCPDEFLCQVKFFNGEMWPFNPSLSRLEILERTHDQSYQNAITGKNERDRDKLIAGLKRSMKS